METSLNRMPSIAIAGSMAQRAGYGGHAWVFLQYLLGFRLLGYEPVFIDRLTADMATDARGRPSSRARTANIRWLTGIMDRFDLAGSYALLLDDGSETVGLTREQALERVRQSADAGQRDGFPLGRRVPRRGPQAGVPRHRPRLPADVAESWARPILFPGTTTSSPSRRTSAMSAARSRPAACRG